MSQTNVSINQKAIRNQKLTPGTWITAKVGTDSTRNYKLGQEILVCIVNLPQGNKNGQKIGDYTMFKTSGYSRIAAFGLDPKTGDIWAISENEPVEIIENVTIEFE